MLWNHLIHILAGILGNNIFIWSRKGVLITALITAGVQLIDTIRIFVYHKKLILASPPDIQEIKMRNYKDGTFYKLSQLYVLKIIWYGLITLCAAAITRHFNSS